MASESSGTPEVEIVPAVKEHTATVIFCHGLGQTVAYWKLDIDFLAQKLPFVKWIQPQAPKRPVSLHSGENRHSWFDIKHLPPYIDEFDEAAIYESTNAIEQLILTEVHNGMDSKRILLVGFSQGAALCLMTALTTLQEIGGIGSLSGWIPHRIRDHVVQNEPSLPIFWAHGDADTEIPLRYARNSIEFLEQRLGIKDDTLCFKEYPDLNHETSEDVLKDLVEWIINILDSHSDELPEEV